MASVWGEGPTATFAETVPFEVLTTDTQPAVVEFTRLRYAFDPSGLSTIP
jgi:hypothetical protein